LDLFGGNAPVYACVFDVETTGFKRYATDYSDVDRIIQLAGVVVKFDPTSGQIETEPEGKYSTDIFTSKEISRFAANAHGITLEQLQTCQSFESAWKEFTAFCTQFNVTVLIGHNAIGFDYQMIAAQRYHNEAIAWPSSISYVVDTLNIAKLLKKDGKIAPASCKLSDLYQYVASIALEGAHDALVDCVALVSVLKSPKFIEALKAVATLRSKRCIARCDRLEAIFKRKCDALRQIGEYGSEGTDAAEEDEEGAPIDDNEVDDLIAEVDEILARVQVDDDDDVDGDASPSPAPPSSSTQERDGSGNSMSDAATEAQQRAPQEPQDTWSTELQPPSLPILCSDVVVGSTLRRPRGSLSALDAFRQFFTDDIIDMIVEESNAYYQEQQGSDDTLFTPARFFTLLQCLMCAGVHRRETHIKEWWADPDGPDRWMRFDAVARTMPKNKFISMLRHLHFTRTTFGEGEEVTDRAYKIRPLLTALNERCQAVYNCNQRVSVDEAMIPLKSRIRIKQYMKNKPQKWGVKMWVLAESRTGFVKSMILYLGSSGPDLCPTMSQLTASSKVVYALMTQASMLGLGHIVYMDNLFSSLPLADALLAANTHMVGTVRRRIKGFPLKRLTISKTRGDSKQLQREDGVLATAWMDRKPVLLLSTFNPTTTTGSARRWIDGQHRDIPRPSIIDDYNQHMGGVDLADGMRSYSMIRLKQMRRWYINVFFYLLDTVIHNANVLFNDHNRGHKAPLKALAFRKAIMNEIERTFRPTPDGEVRRADRRKGIIARMEENHKPERVKTKGRCKHCKNDSRKVRTICSHCKVYLHAVPDPLTGQLSPCWHMYHKQQEK